MVIQGERVWLGGQFVSAQLVITDGNIEAVRPWGTVQPDRDYGGLRIVPGFIDVHTHGAYGFDTNDGGEDGLRNWLAAIPEEGVTALCPTTVTQSPEVLLRALENVDTVANKGYEGAEIAGIHLEGPFLSLPYKGAQPEEYIAPPSVEQFEKYQSAAGGRIRLITLAPEEDVEFVLTRHCASHGVAVSMGHSAATLDQALMGIANGAVSMTHVYNGMSPFNHREPGMVGAALRTETLFGEIIGDCVHSHPAALHAFFAVKGRERAVMISDSLLAKGCPKGLYSFGGNQVEIRENGTAYLPSGTIAGSTMRMNQGLRNLVERALVPFDAALNACTCNPARLLGLDRRKGKLVAGYDADIVVLEDDYSVAAVYCRGKGQDLGQGTN